VIEGKELLELANDPLEDIEDIMEGVLVNNPLNVSVTIALLVIKGLSVKRPVKLIDTDTEELGDSLFVSLRDALPEELGDPLFVSLRDAVPDKQDVAELVGIFLKTNVPLGLYE